MLNSSKVLCAFDIDGTQYVCLNSEYDAFSRELCSTMDALRSNGVIMVHNTGRYYPWTCFEEPVVERYLNPVIPSADYIIHSAGTAIYDVNKGGDLSSWKAVVDSSVTSVEIESLRKEIERIPGLSLRNEVHTTPYKTACLAQPALRAEIDRALEEILRDKFSNRFEASFWNDTDIEFSPVGINKQTALIHLSTHVDPTNNLNVIVGGDHANDLSVLTDPRFSSIVVGNAPDFVKNTVKQQNPKSFIASPRFPVAKGLLAGMRHFGLIDRFNNPALNRG